MRRTLLALALAVTLPLPVLAGQVTVKEGETLSEIAERHGISLDRLMRINGISDADLVEAGRKLTIPGSGAGSARAGRAPAGSVTVEEGDTLSEIAERHNIGLTRLMQINGIRDADQVQVGQTLRLQGAAQASARSTNTPAPLKSSYPAGASEHVVRSGESLSVIASGYGIGLSKLIAINGISDPDLVEAGTRLKLKGSAPASTPRPAVTPATVSRRPQPQAPVATATTRPAATAATTPAAGRPGAAATPAARPATPATTVAMARADWRTYGPLQVNWSAWQPMGGSMVAPTLNRQGQPLYVAINCGARKVNSTTPSGEWQSWNEPKGDDEQQLVADYCRSRS